MGAAAVIVGLHQNGLGVARALGRSGIRVIAVDQPRNDAYGSTRYATRQPRADLRGTGLIDTLEEVGRSLGHRGILILTLDRSVLLVSEHRDRLEPYFTHSLPPDAVIQRLMHKTQIDHFAASHGFKVPRTFSVRTEHDLDACIAELSLPCILKPEVKTVAFVEHSPRKAFYITSADELRQTWHQVIQWEPGVVVQEWIPGPETNLVFCLFYFDAAGHPLASFTGRKIRQYIPHCGTACCAEPFEDETAFHEGVRFFQAAGYRGFGAIEFKIGPDGEYYLIEPTVGRTEHIFALAAANGINIPLAGYCDMAGLPQPRLSRRPRATIYVDWKRDLRAAQALVGEGALTWPRWVRSIARPSQRALLAWDDPQPFVHHVAERLGRGAGRLSGRVRRAVQHRVDAWRQPSRLASAGLGAALMPRRAPADPASHQTAALEWLCRAQDAAGGGVSRGYVFSSRSGYPVGWQHAYPETTGYIIPTFFDAAAQAARPDLYARAVRMADWELTVQLENGAFPGGTVGQRPVPVVFNTGMVLLGLTRAYAETTRADYRRSVGRAADFLLSTQAKDGAWRRYVNMSGEPHTHAYDCLVNWGLVQAARQMCEPRWAEAATRNLQFTLTLQAANGWFADNALRPARNRTPLTHTIAYAIAGCLETGLLLGEPRFVSAAERTASAVLERLGPDGFLAGEFHADWTPAADWCCLTGTAQMAILWWRLFELNGDPRYADAARRATAYVSCRHEVAASDGGTRGGVAGSFPVHVGYGRYQFLNWAAKFFVDALLLQARLMAASPLAISRPAGTDTGHLMGS